MVVYQTVIRAMYYLLSKQFISKKPIYTKGMCFFYYYKIMNNIQSKKNTFGCKQNHIMHLGYSEEVLEQIIDETSINYAHQVP